MTRVLLVCTGNTCRSPMAEAMLRQLAERRGVAVEVRSAGISTIDGLPVSANALQVLAQRGLRLEGSSRMLNEQAVMWANLIFTMTTSHKQTLLQRFPDGVGKAYTLKEYVSEGTTAEAETAELEQLYAEWQLKRALGQGLTVQEKARMLELERQHPGFDIADPFGGSLDIYEDCAEEISVTLEGLLDKLEREA